MAHKTDVIQVHKDYPSSKSSDSVVDPHCGKKMTHQEAKSLLFEGDQTIYFCSKECRENFLSSRKKSFLRAA